MAKLPTGTMATIIKDSNALQEKLQKELLRISKSLKGISGAGIILMLPGEKLEAIAINKTVEGVIQNIFKMISYIFGINF